VRPMYGCPENFRESLSTPTTTFPEIVIGLLFLSILRMWVQNLKFVAIPVPGSRDNRGYFKTLRSPRIRPRSLFSKMSNGLLLGWTI